MTRVEEIVNQLRGKENNSDIQRSNYRNFMIAKENDRMFAFPVDSLVETIEINENNSIVSIPLTDDYILGVVNVRGEMVPVLSLIAMGENLCESHHYILVVENKFKVGFAFSSIVEIEEVDTEKILPITVFDERATDFFISEEFPYQKQPVSVIDVDKMFCSEFLV